MTIYKRKEKIKGTISLRRECLWVLLDNTLTIMAILSKLWTTYQFQQAIKHLGLLNQVLLWIIRFKVLTLILTGWFLLMVSIVCKSIMTISPLLVAWLITMSQGKTHKAAQGQGLLINPYHHWLLAGEIMKPTLTVFIGQVN